MIVAIISLSVIFIFIGFIINVRNAKYLLAGYNTMSAEERENINIESYIKYFRKFHFFLGISLLIIGTIIFYFINSNWSGIFLGCYPILAYIYFIWKEKKFYKTNTKKNIRKSQVIIGILLISFIFIIFMLTKSLQDNNIVIENQAITIEGDYGFKLKTNDIQSIELVNNLPQIESKINGFDLETIMKGDFLTKDGEKVKLIINSDKKPIILIIASNNNKIYYSSKNQSNQQIFNSLKNAIKK